MPSAQHMLQQQVAAPSSPQGHVRPSNKITRGPRSPGTFFFEMLILSSAGRITGIRVTRNSCTPWPAADGSLESVQSVEEAFSRLECRKHQFSTNITGKDWLLRIYDSCSGTQMSLLSAHGIREMQRS